MNKKLIVAILAIVVGGFFWAIFFMHNKSDMDLKKINLEGTVSIHVPFDFICMKDVLNSPDDIGIENFKKKNWPFPYELFQEIKENIERKNYLDQKSYMFRSYTHWINNKSPLDDDRLIVVVKINNKPSYPKEILNWTTDAIHSFFYIQDAILIEFDDINKIRKNNVKVSFIKTDIYDIRSEKAFMNGKIELDEKNNTIAKEFEYFLFNDYKTIIIQFYYESKIDDEKYYDNNINLILNSIKII